MGIYIRHGHKSPGRLSLLKSIKYKATSTSACWCWLTKIVFEINMQTHNGGVVSIVLSIWSLLFPLPSEGFTYTLNQPASLWHNTWHALFNVDISLRWCKGARWPSGGGPVPGEISPSTLNIFVWPNWQNESLSEDRHLGCYMGLGDLHAGGHPSLLMHCNCTNLHIHCIRHCSSLSRLLWPGRSLSLSLSIPPATKHMVQTINPCVFSFITSDLMYICNFLSFLCTDRKQNVLD